MKTSEILALIFLSVMSLIGLTLFIFGYVKDDNKKEKKPLVISGAVIFSLFAILPLCIFLTLYIYINILYR